ncbi:CapA family protein [Syntrophomonas palmitatica]|uniref:CapA family protein n=1 Tax=Syntrophomonas palmitatica TaxID=402877 RepID=UPI000AA3A516|nr:CapA family protein [Syntrophomonas palmitatica]
MQPDGSYRFEGFFREVEDLIKEGDYSSTDFEAALAGSETGYTGYPLFNSPDAIADFLKRAGFDLVITANNHCLDRGYAGGIRTLRVLKQAGLDTLGTYENAESSKKYLIKNIRGVKIAYLAYTYGTNGIPIPSEHPDYVNFLDKDKILQDIKTLRPEVDIIILALHWGVEYQPRPNQDQIMLACSFLEAGADVILGSHPHVIQTMETINIKGQNKFVIYSMGNFISSQIGNERNSGIVLKMKFKKDFAAGKTDLQEVSYTPTFTHSYYQSGKRYFRVIPIERTIQKIKQGEEPLMNQADLSLLQSVLASTRQQLGPAFKAAN